MKTKSRTFENPQASMRDFLGEVSSAAGAVCVTGGSRTVKMNIELYNVFLGDRDV